jgi:hypothetical protein
MKVYSLKGNQVRWKLDGYAIGQKPAQLCSTYHLEARTLLLQIFPVDIILEEVPIPESDLRLDFFLPHKRLAVEVDGQQHETYTPFFHQTKARFLHAQSNDKIKDSWCETNQIKIVHLKWDDEESWKNQLLSNS